jgi:cation transport ATPase
VNDVELSISGMTCSFCAVRLNKKLNKINDASVNVNFATEKAKVLFVADVLPSEKVDVGKRLQREASALPHTHLGIALGADTDVAIEAADLTRVRGDLRAAADAIALLRATQLTINGNLFWAFANSVAALPLAALALIFPLIAGAAMASSSVFVGSNSLRLRRFKAVSATSTGIAQTESLWPLVEAGAA